MRAIAATFTPTRRVLSQLVGILRPICEGRPAGVVRSMQTVGLIGGLSWHSTVIYYRRINELVQGSLGGNHSAQLLLHSVDFGVVELAQIEKRWHDLAAQFVEIAKGLEAAGVAGIAI